MNQQPLTIDEYERLFRVLDLMSKNIDRLLTQGVAVMNESLDAELMDSSQRKIQNYRTKIQREQDRLRKLRDYLRRKKGLNRKRDKSTSEH